MSDEYKTEPMIVISLNYVCFNMWILALRRNVENNYIHNELLYKRYEIEVKITIKPLCQRLRFWVQLTK